MRLKYLPERNGVPDWSDFFERLREMDGPQILEAKLLAGSFRM